MAVEHWFRWHHGAVTDPKWRVVAKRASDALSRNVTIGHVVAVWAAMMERASQSNPRGHLVGWCDEDVGAALDIGEDEVGAIRSAMQGKTLDGDELTGWKRRQPKAEDATAAERKARQRERAATSVNARDTPSSAGLSRDVTGSHDRGEEIRGEEEHQSSLRSDSSTAAPPTPAGSSLEAKAQRLAAVTADAIAAYNARMAMPNGLLARATEVGIENKRAWVKRALHVIREICRKLYGVDAYDQRFFTDYFAECDRSDHHSGRQGGGKSHDGWLPDLEYLTRPKVIMAVFERSPGADA